MRYFVGVLLALSMISGCTQTNASEDPDLKPAEPKPTKKLAAWPTDVKIHRNEKGEVVCPIMGGAIESPDKAVGYQDYMGVRYYFCCDMCPDKFKSEAEKYAEKK